MFRGRCDDRGCFDTVGAISLYDTVVRDFSPDLSELVLRAIAIATQLEKRTEDKTPA